MKPSDPIPQIPWRDVILRWQWWSQSHPRPSLAEVLRQTIESHLQRNGYRPARYFPGTHVVVGTGPPVSVDEWLRGNLPVPSPASNPLPPPAGGPAGAADSPAPAQLRVEAAFKWSFVLLFVLLILVVVKLSEKCVDFGLYRSFRRRTSDEWLTPPVTATCGQNSLECDSDASHANLEFTESMRNDYPPPYSAVNKSYPDEPPPPYSACIVAFSNPKNGTPSVHFYNERRQSFFDTSEQNNINTETMRRLQNVRRNTGVNDDRYKDCPATTSSEGSVLTADLLGETSSGHLRTNDDDATTDDSESERHNSTQDAGSSSRYTEGNERTKANKKTQDNKRQLDKIRKVKNKVKESDRAGIILRSLSERTKRSKRCLEVDLKGEDVKSTSTLPSVEIVRPANSALTTVIEQDSLSECCSE